MNAIVTDGVQGYTARVDQSGNLATKVTGSVDVTGSSVAVSNTPLPVSVPAAVAVYRVALARTANVGGAVTTTPDVLVPQTTGRQAIYFRNAGSSDVYINFGAAVTTDDFKLAPGEKYAFESVGQEEVYAMTSSGTSTVCVIEWVPL
jgi:hypothetical protein